MQQPWLGGVDPNPHCAAYTGWGARIGVAVLAVGAVLLAVNLRYRSLALRRS